MRYCRYDDPLGLGALADNGGPTETRLPVIGGPAVAAITLANCVETTDQRAEARPGGAGCDIGAVELVYSVTATNDAASTVASPVVIDVLSNDTAKNTSLDPASVSATVGPNSGHVTFSAATGKATYTPDNGFAGIDEFTDQVCGDTHLAVCDTATVTITPARLLETRAGNKTFDHKQEGIGRGGAKQVTTVQIAGRAGIPTDADAAIINIGAVNPAANGATIKLSPAGTICIYTHQAMDLIIDVTGYTPNIP